MREDLHIPSNDPGLSASPRASVIKTVKDFGGEKRREYILEVSLAGPLTDARAAYKVFALNRASGQ